MYLLIVLFKYRRATNMILKKNVFIFSREKNIDLTPSIRPTT